MPLRLHRVQQEEGLQHQSIPDSTRQLKPRSGRQSPNSSPRRSPTPSTQIRVRRQLHQLKSASVANSINSNRAGPNSVNNERRLRLPRKYSTVFPLDQECQERGSTGTVLGIDMRSIYAAVSNAHSLAGTDKTGNRAVFYNCLQARPFTLQLSSTAKSPRTSAPLGWKSKLNSSTIALSDAVPSPTSP